MANVTPPGAGVTGPTLFIAGTPVANSTSGYLLRSVNGLLQEIDPASLPGGNLTVDSTPVNGGTIGNIFYHEAGNVLGELTTTGTGTVVALAASPVFTGTPTVPTAATGTNTTQPASTAFVNTAIANAIAGVNPAVAVSAATTAAANTSAWTYANGVAGVGATFTGPVNTAITIDGVLFNTITTQSLLVKNDTQSPSGAFNGTYVFTAAQTVGTGAIFTRRLDYDTPSDINNTGAIPVVGGTVNALTSWLLTSSVVTVGTSPLTYSQFSYSPLSVIGPTLGGTGIANNAASTQTISGNFGITWTVTATANYTLPPATCSLGYLNIPQNSQSAAYTTVLADAGEHIYHPGADTTARIWTIDSNANVPYAIGTAITFINDTLGGVITIAITSDTLVLAGTGSTGSRTLAASNIATAIKVAATRWIISGSSGLT